MSGSSSTTKMLGFMARIVAGGPVGDLVLWDRPFLPNPGIILRGFSLEDPAPSQGKGIGRAALSALRFGGLANFKDQISGSLSTEPHAGRNHGGRGVLRDYSGAGVFPASRQVIAGI